MIWWWHESSVEKADGNVQIKEGKIRIKNVPKKGKVMLKMYKNKE